MTTDSPRNIPRKPVQSTSLQHPGPAGHHVNGENAQASQSSNSLNRKPNHQLAEEAGSLLHNDRNSTEATTVQEKQERPERRSTKARGLARRYKELSSRTWLWECLSCIAVVGLSCAIIAVLAVYNGKPLPRLPFSVSLNALVSLLATALKATLIVPTAACISQLKWSWYRRTRSLLDIATYDEASRGPYGALVFLCSPSLPGLATLGAVLTIFAVAIDPFTQQIIRYRPCASSYSNSSAAVVKAQNYSVSGRLATAGSQNYMQMMDIDMQAAIYQGAYGSPSNGPNLLVRCETGNCSFPHHAGIAYQSLGICHKCADVSSSIITFCENGTFPRPGTESCNYTLPLQANTTSSYLRESNDSSILWPATNSNDSSILGPAIPSDQYWQGAHVLQISAEYTREQLYAQSGGYSGEPHPYPGVELIDTNSVGKFAYISSSYYPNETAGSDESPINNYPIAIECGLYPCIQSYSASVNKGLLAESLLHQQYLHWPNLPAVDLNAVASPCVVEGKLIDASDIQISYNISTDALGVSNGTPDIAGVTDANHQCLYRLSMASISAMEFFFAGVFTGDVYDSSPYTVSGPPPGWLSMLWREGANNLTTTNTTMANIATSMTNHMRLRASNSEPVLGQVWWSETCVEVQWAWLTLHAVLVILCISFLALTMLVSSKHTKAQLWKSSAIALMYHGLDDVTTEKVGMIEAVDEMEDRARSLRVHSAYTDQGWRFVESSS